MCLLSEALEVESYTQHLECVLLDAFGHCIYFDISFPVSYIQESGVGGHWYLYLL